MMRIKQLLCTIMLTLTTTVTAYASAYTAQIITIAPDAIPTSAIDVTDTKIITDNFSFKIPEGWIGNCVVLHDGDTLEIYSKSLYEADGSGLLFTIESYSDSSYQDLSDYSILGFNGDSTYVLIEDYVDTFEDCDSPDYQSCSSSVKALKKSFVSFIEE